MTMDQRQLTLVAKVQIALNRQIFVIRMTINGDLYQTLFLIQIFEQKLRLITWHSVWHQKKFSVNALLSLGGSQPVRYTCLMDWPVDDDCDKIFVSEKYKHASFSSRLIAIRNRICYDVRGGNGALPLIENNQFHTCLPSSNYWVKCNDHKYDCNDLNIAW